MIWSPIKYTDRFKGEVYEKQCSTSITTQCGKYRIGKCQVGAAWKYQLWSRNPWGATFTANAWHHLGTYPDPDSAKSAAEHHAAQQAA